MFRNVPFGTSLQDKETGQNHLETAIFTSIDTDADI